MISSFVAELVMKMYLPKEYDDLNRLVFSYRAFCFLPGISCIGRFEIAIYGAVGHFADIRFFDLNYG